jgi:hypothetical protein
MQQLTHTDRKPIQRPEPLVNVWDSADGRIRSKFICIPPTQDDLRFGGSYTFNAEESGFAQRTSEEMFEHGINEAYFLNATQMNARVIDPILLATETALPLGNKLLMNVREPGEIVELDPSRNETLSLLLGGCGIGIATAEGAVLGFHLGTESLVDFERVRTGKASREDESVFHAIARQFDAWRIPRYLVSCRVCFYLLPKVLRYPREHDVHGQFNRLLFEDLSRSGAPSTVMKLGGGLLSIPALSNFRVQELGLGSISTSCPLPSQGRFGHTRHEVPEYKQARNWAFVSVREI